MIKIECDGCAKDMSNMKSAVFEFKIYSGEKETSYIFCNIDCVKKFISEIKEVTTNGK